MTKDKAQTRIESDTMGNLKIPVWAYWGAQTQRAINNFTASRLRIPPAMLKALMLIKYASALVNRNLEMIDTKIALQAFAENKTVKQVTLEQGILTLEEAEELLNPQNMVGPSPE